MALPTPITTFLFLLIQLRTSPSALAPVHTPFLHVPSPAHGVPSRKFCCMPKQVLAPNSGEEQVSWQLVLSQDEVSLALEYWPMIVWHC